MVGHLDEMIDWRHRDGARWSEIRDKLKVNRHDIFRALRDEIEQQFGDDIVSRYERYLGSRVIEAEIGLSDRLRCNGEACVSGAVH